MPYYDDTVEWGTVFTIINEVPFQTFNGTPVNPDVVTFNFTPPAPDGSYASLDPITYTYTNGASPPDPEYMISPYSVAITSITPTFPVPGQVSFATAAPNLLRVGQEIVIAGASPSPYNGTFTIVGVQTGNAFSVANTEVATPTVGSSTVNAVGVFQLEVDTTLYNKGVMTYWVTGAPGESGLDVTHTQVASFPKSILIR